MLCMVSCSGLIWDWVCDTGRDSVGTRVWLGLLLWATMCVGELRLVSQSVLAMYLWIALFTLPYLYRQAGLACARCHAPAYGLVLFPNMEPVHVPCTLPVMWLIGLSGQE